MDCVEQRCQVLRVYAGMDTMAQVEHVAAALAVAFQRIGNCGADTFRPVPCRS